MQFRHLVHHAAVGVAGVGGSLVPHLQIPDQKGRAEDQKRKGDKGPVINGLAYDGGDEEEKRYDPQTLYQNDGNGTGTVGVTYVRGTIFVVGHG